jgi:hypothetical protein
MLPGIAFGQAESAGRRSGRMGGMSAEVRTLIDIVERQKKSQP